MSSIQPATKDEFLSAEIALAPPHPLTKELEQAIPNCYQASVAEIREIQRRDRIPGLVKRVIPLDTQMSWEYWWCVPGRLLLPEDVELLKRDRDRVHQILAKLVWLFGAYCFDAQSNWQGDHERIHDWQAVLDFAQAQGFDGSVLDIDFFPAAVKPYAGESDRSATAMAVEPTHWHIEFFQIQPTTGGFEIQEPKKLCSCQIWLGQPFLKAPGEESVTRYDLWVAKPLNITHPSWRDFP